MTSEAGALEFFFDFSSPYAYLAAHRISAIAVKHGRAVAWKPILLGAVFKVTGAKPLVDHPLKGDYSRRDMERSARRIGLPLVFPQPFPFNSIAAGRAFYWLSNQRPELAVPFALAIYQASFGQGIDVSNSEAVAAVGSTLGIEPAWLLSGIAESASKEQLRAETDRAIELGVFGAPTVIVDGEMFWGADRLDHVEDWLARGGW